MSVEVQYLETVDLGHERSLSAGLFGRWLTNTQRVAQQGGNADVACGTCAACCRSAYFIHVTPEDVAAHANIPEALLFAAPGLPNGHAVMGFNEQGHCPMLTDAGCSIYEHRPQTCRTYDCRIFPAAGITAGIDKALINEQVRYWHFDYAEPDDKQRHLAVRRATQFLVRHESEFPSGFVPSNATQLAVLAVTVHQLFVNQLVDNPTADEIRQMIDAVVNLDV